MTTDPRRRSAPVATATALAVALVLASFGSGCGDDAGTAGSPPANDSSSAAPSRGVAESGDTSAQRERSSDSRVPVSSRPSGPGSSASPGSSAPDSSSQRPGSSSSDPTETGEPQPPSSDPFTSEPGWDTRGSDPGGSVPGSSASRPPSSDAGSDPSPGETGSGATGSGETGSGETSGESGAPTEEPPPSSGSGSWSGETPPSSTTSSGPGTVEDPGLSGWGVDRAAEPGEIVLPAIPRALTPMPVDGGLHVRWWPVEGASGYVLYRSDRPGRTPDRAERRELVDPEYMDRSVAPGQRRYYAVAAIVDGVEGPVSGEIGQTAVAPISPRSLLVTMEEADLDLLYSRNRYSDDQLPAQVEVVPDNEPLDVEGLRFRGSGSRRYPKLGFNIRLDNRPDFNFGDAYRSGANRILLNAMWTDPTAMRDEIGLGAYRALGLISPRTQYADLHINGIYEGFYVLFERIDREALRGWNLNRRRGGMSLLRDDLKGNRRRYGLDDVRSTFGLDLRSMYATDEERIAFLQDVWEWRGEMEDHDWEGLLDLVLWVGDAEPGPDFAAGLRQRFHYQDLLTTFALHALFSDTDSWDSDFWLYRDEDGDGLWRMIPWDTNLVLGSNWYGDFIGNNDFYRYDVILLNPLSNRLIPLFLDTPELWADLEEHLRELMRDHIHRGWIEEQIALLLPRVMLGLEPRTGDDAFVRHPQQHHGEVGYLPHYLEQVAWFMDLRHAWLLKEMDRRNNTRTGWTGQVRVEGVAVAAGEQRCLTDRIGHTYLCLAPRRGWNGSVSVSLVEDPDIDGVRWRYVVQLSTAFDGTLILHYHNRPGRNWVAEEHWSNNQWRLEMVRTGEDGQAVRLRSRVNPLANMVIGEGVVPPGVHTFTLQHGPGPEFPLDGHAP